MDFGLSDEQARLATSVRQVIESRYPMTYVRSMLEDERRFSQAFWADAARLGWLGLLIDERFGGAGLGLTELVAVQQELGRGVIPGPYLSSAVFATAALVRGGSASQQTRWLPRFARGETIGTVAFQEATGRWDPSGVTLAAQPGPNGTVRLSGEKRFVSDAHVADFIVVPARSGGSGPDGVTLFLVETSAPGVSVRPMETIDPTRRLCEVRLDGVAVNDEAVLGRVEHGWSLLEDVADLGRVALCAEMVGGAERALDMSTEYARVREQFGRPIGSFQAIQHKCADLLVKLEGARSMTFAAAMSLASGDPD
ncbi:MAG: acyl-CoA/acyl-ACP dehydrogenase, partial [Gemmatimonadota bacterium]